MWVFIHLNYSKSLFNFTAWLNDNVKVFRNLTGLDEVSMFYEQELEVQFKLVSLYFKSKRLDTAIDSNGVYSLMERNSTLYKMQNKNDEEFQALIKAGFLYINNRVVSHKM